MATLKIEKLTKVFFPAQRNARPVQALDDVDFEVSGDAFVSVVGPSGCGKSTLLNIISGVEVPTDGNVTVTHAGRAARLGYVFQDARLLPWRTVIDNMLYVQEERNERGRQRALHYLSMVGLEDAADRYPSELSGGMQQRVGIARAFSVEPDLLLMDEPFSHLDAITARALREQLQEIWLKTQKTVLFVTHDVMEAVQLADRIIVLQRGGKIYADINIDLPRPRKASDPDVATTQAEVLSKFEAMQAQTRTESTEVAGE